MPYSYQKERYSRSAIQHFVSQQQERMSEIPLTLYQIQSDELFKDIPTRPDGPVDLLYLFRDDTRHVPALGFQEVDTEQDEEEMYALVYLDPSLQEAWQRQEV